MPNRKAVTDPDLLKAKKAEGEEAEEELGEENEGEEEMEKKGKCVKKADDLTQDDLQKSLDKLEELATDDDGVSRKQVLLEKAQSEELDKAEQEELFKLLGGSESAAEEDPGLGEEVTKGMNENDTMQKALDVSDYLQEQHNELVKSLNVVAEALEKSDNRQHEFNLVLAKAVRDIGRHTVAMSERLGIIETQPARKPKSKGITQPLDKSFAGQPSTDGAGDLSKAQILDALDEMVQKSVDDGNAGATENGMDLVMASSKYEQFNSLSPAMLKLVRAHIQSKGATTH